MWFLYIVRCGDDSLYVGISIDVERRFQEHCDGGKKSARYLRGRSPLKLVYQLAVGDRSLASRYEYACKQLAKADKELLVAGQLDLLDYIDMDED
jgi:putative endonuclease